MAEKFSLEQANAGAIVAGVAMVTRDWRAAAMGRGTPAEEIDRLAEALEQSESKDALMLSVRANSGSRIRPKGLLRSDTAPARKERSALTKG